MLFTYYKNEHHKKITKPKTQNFIYSVHTCSKTSPQNPKQNGADVYKAPLAVCIRTHAEYNLKDNLLVGEIIANLQPCL